MVDSATTPELTQAVEMTKLAMDVKNIKESLSDIQRALTELVKIDKDISGIMLQNQNIQKEIKTVWDRYDTVKEWQVIVDASLNQAKGARNIINLVLGFIQIVVVAAGGWLFVKLDEARTDNVIQAQQIAQLRQTVESIKR